MKKVLDRIYILTPLLILLIMWELFSHYSPNIKFLFSSPTNVLLVFFKNIINGKLLEHTLITGFESLVGLILGLKIGSSIGFILLYSPVASKISKYYVIALSSIPIFALAPMMIIWFGTGVIMKIALSFFATVFIAIFQSYQGGKNIKSNENTFFKLNHASAKQQFWHLTFPSSIDWLIQSLKINAGLSILGAFIGEFIASNKGLGYFILKASGLYDVSSVLAGTIAIILLTLLFNVVAVTIEKNKIKIIRRIVQKT